MTGLSLWLCGYVRLCVANAKTQDTVALLNLLAKENIQFWGFEQDEEKTQLCILESQAARLCAKELPDSVFVTHQGGLPQWLRRYRHRFGLAFGALLFCFLLWLSGQFVWSVEVEGNETVTKEEIVEGLERLGCGVGAYLPRLDCYLLSKEYLLSEPRLSYVAVVRDGNVITVRVREGQSRPEATEKTLANLVAKEDGVIVSTALCAGQRVVQAGDTVRKGELLVSGLVENKTGSYTLVGASGRVLARVTREISVEIPLVQSEICQKETLGSEKIVKIFGKSIKFSKMGGNLGGKYDTIIEEENVVLFGRVTLPIRITKIRYVATEEKHSSITQAQAMQRAEAALAKEIETLANEVQILSQEAVVQTMGETSVTLSVRVHCIADIAQTQPILQ